MADVNGTNGNDIINTGSGNDTINSGNGNDTVNAGAGNDTVNAGNGNDTVYGGSGIDTLFGENGDDIIDGGTDDDVIDGGNGKDTLFGGAGNDKITGGNGADLVYGGSGNDTIGSASTRCNEESTQSSENGGDLIFGDGYDSYVAGQAVIPTGAGANTIAGNDIIFAGNGNDVIWGDNGTNAIIGGNDIIYAGNGNDTVNGEGGDDRLMGEAGNDTLNGGAGNDIIVGGLGLDTMTGGTGNDKFVFSAGLSSTDHANNDHNHHGYDHDNMGNWTDSNNSAKDVITDFVAIKDLGATPGQLDQIDLTQLLGATDLNWGGTTPTANGVWYVKDIPNNVTYVYADINGNLATPELAIKLLGLHDLTNGDFCGVKNAGVTIVTGNTTATGTVTEIADNAAGETTAVLTANGLIDFNDADFGSVHTASVAATPASYIGTFALGVLNDVTTTVGWTFTVNDGALDYLAAGQQLVQNYSVTISDGLGGTVTQIVAVTINGTNDAATVSSATVALAETNLALSTGGTLTSDDVDNPDNTFTASATTGSIGDFSIDAAGVWTFTANSAFDNLNVGDSVAETFNVTSVDGTASTVKITINGTNDAATITGISTINLTETNAALLSGGALSAVDPDNSNAFTIQTNVAGSNGYGKFSINAGGTWTYLANTAHNEFVDGTTYIDTITVATADGTTKVLTVNILGTDDAPVTSPVTLAAIAEDSGARLITQAQLLASASDIDSVSLTATNLAISSGAGTLVNNNNGTWSYTPALNDDTSVSFSYLVSDGILAAPGSATLDITPVNDAPLDLKLLAIGDFTGNNNLPAGADFAQVQVPAISDPDGGGAYTFSLLSLTKYSLSNFSAGALLDNTPDITFNAATQMLSTSNNGNTALETNRVYDLDIQVTQGSASYHEVFSIITGTVNGTDSITGAYVSGDDVIYALNSTGSGSDVILAGSGNDTVFGQNGADTINGGAGNDILSGGGSNDTFVFTDMGSTNADTIQDFDANNGDTLVLSDGVFNLIGISGSNLDSGQFASIANASVSHSNASHIVFDQATGNLWYDTTGNTVADATLIATITVTQGTFDAGDIKLGA